MKPSEEMASSLYQSYLQGRYRSVTCTRGDDPPDFVFTCDGERHAVEVTELHQYLDVQGKEQSRRHYDEAIAAICERCEMQLGPTLDRTIIVEISAPITQGELKSLPDQILSYARRGEWEEETLFGRDDCSLRSSHGDPSIIGLPIPAAHSTVPGSQTLSTHIQACTDYALNRVLEAKLPSLQALGVFQEKVLIVYLADPFCSLRHVEHWARENSALLRQSLTKVFLINSFVYIIPKGRRERRFAEVTF